MSELEELERRLQPFEAADDARILPGLYMVARLDGRGFTRLTKERHAFEAPFDARFRDLMIGTSEAVMTSGFRVVFALTQSDEISLLFHRDDATFGRSLRKLHSLLAAEASAAFSLLLGDRAAFDCRIVQLPSLALVADYFRWRSEDGHRNALSGHCYWALRQSGLSARDATAQISGLSVAAKNELLFTRRGLNFNDVPSWQKRGVGLYWDEVERAAVDPRSGAACTALRRELRRELELPLKERLGELVVAIVRRSEADAPAAPGDGPAPP